MFRLSTIIHTGVLLWVNTTILAESPDGFAEAQWSYGAWQMVVIFIITHLYSRDTFCTAREAGQNHSSGSEDHRLRLGNQSVETARLSRDAELFIDGESRQAEPCRGGN